MKAALVALLICFAPHLGGSMSVQGRVITLTEDEVRACIEQGGCIVITRQRLYELTHEPEAPPREPAGKMT